MADWRARQYFAAKVELLLRLLLLLLIFNERLLWLLLRATCLGINQAGLFERAWWAAVLILVLLHATDLPLYDGRVNVAGWLLLAGLRAACWPQGFKPN